MLCERLNRTRAPTAALVIEIVSPDDDTWNKVPFYGNYGPDERPIVDLQRRRVDWLGLGPSGEYRALERSRLIEPEPAELAQRLDWPPPASYTESGTGHALPGPGLVISSPHGRGNTALPRQAPGL